MTPGEDSISSKRHRGGDDASQYEAKHRMCGKRGLRCMYEEVECGEIHHIGNAAHHAKLEYFQGSLLQHEVEPSARRLGA